MASCAFMVHSSFLGPGLCIKKGIEYTEGLEHSESLSWKVGAAEEGLKSGRSSTGQFGVDW